MLGRLLRSRRTWALVAGVGLASGALVGALELSQGSRTPAWVGPAPIGEDRPDRPHGGIVRVGVTTPPEAVDRGPGGDTLRQLTYPKLFVAQPDGTWRASMVEPGSDRTAKDAWSASFRLRDGARWSDGTAITVADLRRTADARFVSAVSDPDADGRITVRFSQRFPFWRQLWSGAASVDPPRSDVYGGPFFVAAVASGEQTVLKANAEWYGRKGGPFLAEVDLVLVADVPTGRALLAAHDIDVMAPVADTNRAEQYGQLSGVKVATARSGGSVTILRANSANVAAAQRRAIFAAFPRQRFVDSLLDGEAELATSLEGGRAERSHHGMAAAVDSGGALDHTRDTTWATGNLPKGADRLDGASAAMVTPSDQPLSTLLQISEQRAISELGGKLDVRAVDPGGIADAAAKGTFDVLVQQLQLGPTTCFQCVLGAGTEPDLAKAADGGDAGARAQLQAKLRDDGEVLPLWRTVPMVASRTDVVSGVEANGFQVGMAWGAEDWWTTQQ